MTNKQPGTNQIRYGFAANVMLLSAASIMFCSCQSGRIMQANGTHANIRQQAEVPVEEREVFESSEVAGIGSLSGHNVSISDAVEAVAGEGVAPDSRQQFDIAQVTYLEVAESDSTSNQSRTAQLPQDTPPAPDTFTPLPQELIDAACQSPIPHLPAFSPEYCPAPQAMPAMPVPYCSKPLPMVAQELKSSFAASDEYLCDGGDREQRVTVGEDFSLKGLNVEDTIAHFDTLDGKRIVQPSNRVCIYAPRFGSVRKTYGVALSAGRTQIAKADKTVGAIDQQDTVASNTTLQHAQPIDSVGAEFAQSFIDRARSSSVDNEYHAMGTDNTVRPYVGWHLLRFSSMDQAQKARLAREAMQAEFWTENQSAQVVVKGVELARAISSQRLQDITGTDERIPRQKLRIIKSASKGAAKPGDLIEFTIRFENLSNEKIGNVTVVDNLTPRLEYIPDSQSCSIKAEFLTTENEGDSLLLRWEIADPMQPDTEGVIRFKCLVR